MRNIKWRFLTLIGLLLSFNFLFAQNPNCKIGKPVIDSGVYGKWPSIGCRISNDGNYAICVLSDPATGKILQTTISAMHSNWKFQIAGQSIVQFSQDSKDYYALRNDTLTIGQTGGAALTTLIGIADFQRFDKGKAGDLLAYHLRNSPQELVFRDEDNNRKFTFGPVIQYFLTSDCKCMAVLVSQNDHVELKIAQLADIAQPEIRTIWTGKSLDKLVWSETGAALAFIGHDDQGLGIFYFASNKKRAEKIADNQSAGFRRDYEVSDLEGLSNNGERIFLTLTQTAKATPKLDKNLAAVDVWSYKDAKPQSTQSATLNELQSYKAMVIAADQNIIDIGNDSELITPIWETIRGAYDYVLVRKYLEGHGDYGWHEDRWNPLARYSIYLKSLKDGSMHPISRSLQNISYSPWYKPTISPSGKYVLYFDPVQKNYFSYTIGTGKLRNITRSIPTIWTTLYQNESYDNAKKTEGIAGWLKDDRFVLIYDQHDIFLFDAEGHDNPINITNGFGKKRDIYLRLAPRDLNNPTLDIDPNNSLVLSAFNLRNQDDGFYRTDLSGRKNPELLSMGPNLIVGLVPGSYPYGNVNRIIKARDAEAYIINRQSAKSFPNYFFTNDLKKYKAISDIHPERDYNWITTQLITWKTFDGTISRGILYKPDNFNPKKRYPVILEYYQKNSDGLNAFLKPDWSEATIDIPTYVSNGYLIFVPDIHYKVGHTLKSAVNCIESGAQYLIRFPWVDGERIGLNGHSFGGVETDYVVTHSNMFAAACANSGWADQVSISNSIYKLKGGYSFQANVIGNHMNIGATLWEQPDLYIENSAIFSANKLTTPLLMMNNKKDPQVDFDLGGVEFFMALRSLGKKVWMLQYDGAGHTLSNNAQKRDLTIRMHQFFDYYLMNKAAPVWMTQGVPARLKQIDSGLEMDNSDTKP
ncbi:MAG TPA: prolyl oligopeptidase family serine peptidase [Mucilaginibacter sp.]